MDRAWAKGITVPKNRVSYEVAKGLRPQHYHHEPSIQEGDQHKLRMMWVQLKDKELSRR